MNLRAHIEAKLMALAGNAPEHLAGVDVALVAGVVEANVRAAVDALVSDGPERSAVLDRGELLLACWPLSAGPCRKLQAGSVADAANYEILRRADAACEASAGWPAGITLREVADALERVDDEDARAVAARLRLAEPAPRDEERPAATSPQETAATTRRLRWHPLGCAAVLAAQRAVRAALRKPAMAIDAGRPHHGLMCGMRDLPKNPVKHRGLPQNLSRVGQDRVEVLAPTSGVQLTLPIDGDNLGEGVVVTLRQWRGWAGLRHWAALLKILSVEGARRGCVRWSLDRHLDALGASQRSREDPEFRAAVGREIELLTRLELAVYAPDGSMRFRQPLLTPTTKFDRIHGTIWMLEGMELQIHPALYGGVRDEDGTVGRNWYPQTADLAKIDHVRFPHAIALGLILPIRWRWDWKDGRDHTRMTGATLLATAGIAHQCRRASAAWNRLRRNLDELVRIGGLGRYTWQGPAWKLDGCCLLHPPQWAVDRTVHALPPIERGPIAVPWSGAELVLWRKREGLTQEQAAERLGVGPRTIKRAEATPEEPLGRALSTAFGPGGGGALDAHGQAAGGYVRRRRERSGDRDNLNR